MNSPFKEISSNSSQMSKSTFFILLNVILIVLFFLIVSLFKNSYEKKFSNLEKTIKEIELSKLEIITNDFAKMSIVSMVEDDTLIFGEISERMKEDYESIIYVVAIDRDKKIWGSSGDALPEKLPELKGERYLLQECKYGYEKIYDAASPIVFGGIKIGEVHIGFNKKKFEVKYTSPGINMNIVFVFLIGIVLLNLLIIGSNYLYRRRIHRGLMAKDKGLKNRIEHLTTKIGKLKEEDKKYSFRLAELDEAESDLKKEIEDIKKLEDEIKEKEAKVEKDTKKILHEIEDMETKKEAKPEVEELIKDAKERLDKTQDLKNKYSSLLDKLKEV